MHSFGKIAIAVLNLSLAINVMGQNSYKPGQTFSSSPTPAPVQQTYRPTAPVSAPPMRAAVPSRPVENSSMYNVENSPKRTDTPAKVSRSVSEKKSEPAVQKSSVVRRSTASASGEVSASKLKPVELEVEKPHSTMAASTDNTTVKPAGAVVEPTDKLMFFSRKTGKKQVALTYDDGPNPAYTPKLVEYLKSNNVPATFYLCGNMVKEHPATAKMLAEQGFELGNHSYDHPILSKLSKEKIIKQLQDTHDLIKEATGVDVRTMRPPFGAQNATVREVCEQMGYKIIQWDVDTEDWKKRSAANVINTIMKQTSDGSIILMHDRKHGSVDSVLEATKSSVDQLRAKGYTFVTIGELIGLDGSASSTAQEPTTSAAEVSTSTTSIPVQPPTPAAAVSTPSSTQSILP